MAHVMTKAMRGTMGAQSRNRVGRREWTWLQMEEDFTEKLAFDWRLDFDNELPSVKRQSSEEGDIMVN